MRANFNSYLNIIKKGYKNCKLDYFYLKRALKYK